MVVFSVWSEDIVTVPQLRPSAEQKPDQSVCASEAVGVADKLTEVPAGKVALQVPELEVHALIPAGVESTAPCPVTATVRVYKGVNVVDSVLSEDIVTAQVEPGEVQSDQVVWVGAVGGVADRLTAVPAGKSALQVPELEPHALIPAGVESTAPDP